MLRKIKEYVTRWHMLEKEDKVIVGVSGGADSICLLFVLLELQKSIPFEIIVVHVNHGLRGLDADEDEAYVKKICEEQDLLCVTYSENVELIAKNRKQSTEEAGREVRYAAFYRTLELYGGTKIALAHHKNDNVETFLMNMARGTGLKGLGGIRPVSGKLIRPLLCMEREEIEQYLQKKGIAYCTDKTNASDEYTRNRIRNHVIPYMEKEINSCTVSHINDTMEQLLEIQSYLEVQRDIHMETCVRVQEDGYIVNWEELKKIPNVIQTLVLKQALVNITGMEKDITSVHLKELQNLFQKQVGRRLDLPYETEALKMYEGIKLRKKTAIETEKIVCEVSVNESNEQQIILENMTLILRVFENFDGNMQDVQKNNTKWFDYDIIKNGLCIRTRKPGDYITIHQDGKKQKLKSYFINEKIPKEERDKVLLVADGSHILWIIGYRVNCRYQADRNTKHVLEIQMNEGESYGRDN